MSIQKAAKKQMDVIRPIKAHWSLKPSFVDRISPNIRSANVTREKSRSAL
jgi:hypothetical protein